MRNVWFCHLVFCCFVIKLRVACGNEQKGMHNMDCSRETAPAKNECDWLLGVRYTNRIIKVLSDQQGGLVMHGKVVIISEDAIERIFTYCSQWVMQLCVKTQTNWDLELVIIISQLTGVVPFSYLFDHFWYCLLMHH